MRRPTAATALAASVLLLTAGCSSGDGDGGGPSPVSSSAAAAPSPSASPGPRTPPAKGSVEVVRTVATGLKSPWGVAALGDDALLVASRDEGTITRIDTGSGKKTEVGEVPGVSPEGEGGLLGLALSPGFSSDHYLYAYFTSASDNRIVRMLYRPDRPAGQQLGEPDTVFRGIPKAFVHNGGRIAFGPDGLLYVGTGEAGQEDLSQDRKSLGGKILRLTPEGEPAPGNPFPDSPVFSWGHRNVQGLAFDGRQRLFAAEFGQDTWDEVNHIVPGGNYGWPEQEGKGGGRKFRDPLAQWSTEDASPSGLAHAEGSLWLAGLRGERLWRVPLDGTEASAKPQSFLEGKYGRLRTVVAAGGDRLWLVTSNTDTRGEPREGDDRVLELRVT
ncbi:PQQ-dependent sugar dehydrogenase [Streptomyces fragilis]|uniref:PQQ-dependent sugar dehydrogenase n=1 Tax=Streptomyces fragilis TaxID=67301 RepID=A0ABV2YKJ5_9ACTN|nr:PQQ-dependent sugar dehydrogenase [Streptomyces fragilis]